MPCKGWLVGKGSKDSFLTHTRGILDLSLNFQLLNYETINFCCLIFWFILPCFCQLSLAFPVSLIPGIFPWFSASGLPYPLYFSPLSRAPLSRQCVRAKESLEKWHSGLSWWLRTVCFRLCPTWYVYSMSVALTLGSEGTVHISSRTWQVAPKWKLGTHMQSIIWVKRNWILRSKPVIYRPLSVATRAFCLTATQQKDILVIIQIDFYLNHNHV